MNIEYMNAIMEFLKNELKDKPNEAWVSFSGDLKKLVDEISSYNNDKVADKEALKNINLLFNNAIKSADKYLKVPFDNNNPNEAIRHNMTKKLNDEFLSKLYVDFSNIDESNKNIKESLDKFRSLPIKVTEDEIKKVGGNLSSRTKLSLDIDGKKVSGVFTPTTSFDSSREFKNILDGIIKKYPRYEAYFSKLNTPAGIHRYTGIEIQEVLNNGRIDTNTLKTLDSYGIVPNELVETFNKFKNDNDFLAANLELIAKSSRFNIGHSINTEVLELKPGDNIDKRNSAMSGIAHMLDSDNILAKSRPITIERNIDGKAVFFEGTFMDEANGKDLNNLAIDDEIFDMNAKNLESGLGKKALADLQVIDYICGNVDRHAGNIFYQFDPKTKKLVGVQGIDNDASFFKRNPKMGDYKHLFVDIPKMVAIDAQMAAKVALLEEAPFKATLMGYGLKNEEINAAWERTLKLQEAIASASVFERGNRVVPDENTVTIIPTDAWDEVKFDDLANLNGTNIFRRVRGQFNSLSGKMSPDNGMRLDTAIKMFAYKSKLEYVNNYLAIANRNSNLFGTSTRFKNIIKALESANNEGDLEKKFQKLDKLSHAIDVYKNEKIRDGFLDKNGNIIKDVTGKALNRINLVNELDGYVKIVKVLRDEYLDSNAKRIENEKYADEFNEIHRKDKYANYLPLIKDQDGKIFVQKTIFERDEQFKDVLRPMQQQMEEKAANGYRSNNEGLVNEAKKLEDVIDKEIKNMKDTLSEEYHNKIIPKEYYDARINELDSRLFDKNMNELFTTNNPQNNNEFQNNLKEDIKEEVNAKEDLNVENNEVGNELENKI